MSTCAPNDHTDLLLGPFFMHHKTFHLDSDSNDSDDGSMLSQNKNDLPVLDRSGLANPYKCVFLYMVFGLQDANAVGTV
jgi:hypothetical protein